MGVDKKYQLAYNSGAHTSVASADAPINFFENNNNGRKRNQLRRRGEIP